MKLLGLSMMGFSLTVLLSSFSFAGGVHCKECPAETDKCAPKPGCEFEAPLTPYTETLHCVQAGLPQGEFTIEENKPRSGLALLSSAKSLPQVLEFTESQRRFSTQTGDRLSIQKVYFHPYYEYNVSAEIALDRGLHATTRPDSYQGKYYSEGNKAKLVSCEVKARKRN
jgi:hypothetical protein